MSNEAEAKIYANMVRDALKEYKDTIDELKFWLEVVEMVDKRGNTRDEKHPRLTISFK